MSEYDVKGFYEFDRMRRYKDHPLTMKHSVDVLAACYRRWATSDRSKCREDAWDQYCDARDNKTFGTNAAIRDKQRLASKYSGGRNQ